MKLLFVAKDYDHFAGGSEICLQTFVKLLIKDNHSCVLITQNNLFYTKTIKNYRKLRIIKITENELINEINKCISTFKPDFIGGQKEWGMQLLMATRNINIPKIYFIKDASCLEDKSMQYLLKFFPIDIVIVNSKFLRNKVLKKASKTPVLSYPLVDKDEYKTNNNSKSFITMIGYRREKGKEIFDRIAGLMPEKKFLAVRGWMPIINLKTKITKNLTIVGPLKNMKKIYSNTKILLIPSICEDIFPRVAMEAQINGIPIIASDVGGLKEAVGKGGTIISDYNDEKVWVNEIQKFNNEKYYQNISYLAKKKAQKFNYLREYQTILSAMGRELKTRSKLLEKIKKRFEYFFYRLYRFIFFKFQTIMSSPGVLFIKLTENVYKFILKFKMPARVFCHNFGWKKGPLIDRYYIEQFLSSNKDFIRGKVLEMGDDAYTKEYGKNRVMLSDVLSIDENDKKISILDDLTKPKYLKNNYYDCFICTQTLHFIFDIENALATSFRTLNKGGTLLITVPGITPISTYYYNLYGQYWSFTDKSLRKLLMKYFPENNIKIEVFGNVGSATAFLYGYPAEYMFNRDLNVKDDRFQVIIGAVAKK